MYSVFNFIHNVSNVMQFLSMRFKCFVAISVVILCFFPCKALATVFIDCDFNSAPSSEEGGGVYTCSTGSMTLFFGSNLSGSVFDHISTGGWNNSGAAKFYTHVPAESWTNSYRQLNASSYTSNTQQNLRYLIKLGPGTSSEIGGKWHLSDAAGGWRTWYSMSSRGCGLADYIQPTVSFNNTSWVLHGGGSPGPGCGYQWCENPATWWDSTLSSCNVVESDIFDYEDYEGQWICVELERHSNGTYKVYIWTQDVAFSGLYYWLDTTMSENLGSAPVGAYLESSTATGKYFIIDEVKVSDSYIGPPEGFASSQSNLDAPTGLQIIE